jgi:hypothetical protein
MVKNGLTLVNEPRSAPITLWTDGVEDGENGWNKQC